MPKMDEKQRRELLQQKLNQKIQKLLEHPTLELCNLCCKPDSTQDVQDALKRVKREDVSMADETGWTPLHYAAYYGQIDVTNILLDHGADPNKAKADGETPLHLATEGRENELLVKLLLKHGASPNAVNTHWGYTPLHSAIDSLSYTMVALLLEHGANPNAVTKTGKIPLPMAVHHALPRIVQVLAKHGANVHQADNKERQTPLHLVACSPNLHLSKLHAQMAKVLLEEGAANPNLGDAAGKTPLHCAVELNHVHVVSVLLAHGAKSLADKRGKIPLQYAAENDTAHHQGDSHGSNSLASDDKDRRFLSLDVTRLLLERGVGLEHCGQPRHHCDDRTFRDNDFQDEKRRRVETEQPVSPLGHNDEQVQQMELD